MMLHKLSDLLCGCRGRQRSPRGTDETRLRAASWAAVYGSEPSPPSREPRTLVNDFCLTGPRGHSF